MKKGLTLIELVVAMAIFLVVITIAIGAFVSISRMKALTSTMKNAQQKTRIAMEMVTRLSRQAEIVLVPSSTETELVLYFDIEGNPSASRFVIEPRCVGCEKTLYYYECPTNKIVAGPGCSSWTEKRDLYTGINILTETGKNSGFIKIGSIPPKLTVNLFGKIGDLTTNTYYSDEINLNTTIILEGVK